MATTTHPRATGLRVAEPRPADVFVAFGITGDLAKVMTFRSLYRLEKRGVLECPIVGVAVDDWTADDLREHAHAAIAAGEPVDDPTFERFASRLSYLQGDFGDADTFKRLAATLGDVRQPVFYLEIPPFLFGTVVAGLAGAGLTENARVVVEKPFGHDLVSARALNEQIHEHVDESQLYRIDHFLGKMAWRRSCTCGSRTRPSSRSGTAATSRRSRSRWPRTSAWTIAATSTTPSARFAMWWSTT
jgi:glucose-6-phosphate 1-dehydrogenase